MLSRVLDLVRDVLRVQLFLQCSLHGARNKRGVRIDELAFRKGDAYSGVEVAIEVILDHCASRSAFSTVEALTTLGSAGVEG